MKIVLLVLGVVLLMQPTMSQDWTISTVAWGTKPSIDLDSDGNLHFGYLYEQAANGWVRHALWTPGGGTYDTVQIINGNFYGPASLRIDHDGNPGISFHRHTPVPEQMYAHFDGATWITVAIASDNHDGWDNSLQYDSNNLPRTSTTDPSALSGTSTGVEYAVFNGVSWSVEAIGTPQINYFSSTSLELDASDNPHITYYDDISADLKYAVKTGGSWAITSVETSGDVGRFASLELDANGDPHISYFQNLEDSMGLVKYASWNGSSWDISVVDSLKRVYLALGRNLTDLQLDDAGNPHISYVDEKVVRYATRNGSTWDVETIVDVNNESTIIGQSSSIAVGEDGTVHIGYYELLTRAPLTGIVKHAVRQGSAVQCADIFFFNAKCNMNGAAQAMVKMSGDFSGGTVTFDLDGENIVANISSNGTNSIAKMTVPHAGMGSHTVTLESPGGCYSPVIFNCQVDAIPDPEWDAIWKEAITLESDLQATTPDETGLAGQPDISLAGNHPNPFNPSTTISYHIGKSSWVTLKVFSTLGEEVATLVNEYQTAGSRTAVWSGRNAEGSSVSSGVYLYRLSAGGIVQSGKMLFMK